MNLENGLGGRGGVEVKNFVVAAVIGIALATAQRALAADDILATKASPEDESAFGSGAGPA